MSTKIRLNVPITKELAKLTNQLVKRGIYASKSEYIRHLIREDWKRNRKLYEGPSAPVKKSA